MAEPGASKHPGLRAGKCPRRWGQAGSSRSPQKATPVKFFPFPIAHWCDGSKSCQGATAEQHSSAPPRLPRALSLERKASI